MKYQFLTKEQQAQELKGRLQSLERRHYLRSLDLQEAQASADAAQTDELFKQAMVNVGVIMQDIADIELSLSALNGK